MRVIPLSEPEISGNEWRYVKDCLDSGWVSSTGAYTTRFEKAVGQYVGAPYAIAVANGTSALHLTLLVAGVEPGDEVLVPALTFVAPVNAVRYCGAHPVFLDSDPDTLGIDPLRAIEFVASHYARTSKGLKNKKSGRLLKAIIPVHIFGHPIDMDPLLKWSKTQRVPIIEDATESLGSTYKGRQTGVMGQYGIFSFNGNKILTTGGGGIVVTSHKAAAERIRHLSTQAKVGALGSDHDEIGYNYRLSALAGAMGVAQLERLDEFIQIKRKNADFYRKALAGLDVELIGEKSWARSNFWLYTLRVSPRRKDALLKYLIEHGIQSRPIWNLIPTLPMYQKLLSDHLDHAKAIHASCLNIPSSVGLKPRDRAFVVKTIRRFFK